MTDALDALLRVKEFCEPYSTHSNSILMEDLETIRAALASKPQEGWVLVPREPTEEMEQVGDNCMMDAMDVGEVYKAMIAAASPPKEGQE